MGGTMTPQELADRLNGRDYGSEMTRAEEAEAKDAGIVVVFGASDDLMEFRGAIDDEMGAWGGAEVWVDVEGLVPNFENACDEPDHSKKDALREYFRREKGGVTIEAHWNRDGYSWTYSTDIPHATFDIMEDGEKYCRGIVFRLEDAKS